jgi:ATP-dependent DNA ligase
LGDACGEQRQQHVEQARRLKPQNQFPRSTSCRGLSAAQAIKTSKPGKPKDASSLLPRRIPPQLGQPVETAPPGSQWVHEIKLDGFRMSARIERGRVQLLTRTGLDWSDKYPSVVAALAKLPVKSAYLHGELCGIGDNGLPSFLQTQAASDGERGVRLVYYAFDLLRLDGRDIASLPLIERKALLEPLIADVPGLQFNGHETGDGELIRRQAGQLGLEGVVSKTINTPCAPGNRGLRRKAKWLKSPGIRSRRLDRSRGIAASSGRASARLL